MTVKELIEVLKTKDENAIVFVDSDNCPSKLETVEDENTELTNLNWLSDEYYKKGRKAVLLTSNN